MRLSEGTRLHVEFPPSSVTVFEKLLYLLGIMESESTEFRVPHRVLSETRRAPGIRPRRSARLGSGCRLFVKVEEGADPRWIAKTCLRKSWEKT